MSDRRVSLSYGPPPGDAKRSERLARRARRTAMEQAGAWGNLDGGYPDSEYGGLDTVDAGGA